MSNSQNKKNEQQNNLCTIFTEQWKKDKLPYGYYYIKTISGGEVIDRYYRDCTDYDLCEYGDVWENRFEDEIIEVLAPVPTYEKWQALNEDVDTTTELWKHERRQLNEKIQLIGNLCVQVGDLKDENQQLKKLLWACQDELYSHLDSDAEAMADVITKVIGKKQW